MLSREGQLLVSRWNTDSRLDVYEALRYTEHLVWLHRDFTVIYCLMVYLPSRETDVQPRDRSYVLKHYTRQERFGAAMSQ